MEISPCCNSVAVHHIATNFCTCHDSTAVVSCTKVCSDHYIRIEVRAKRNFHGIWSAMENPLVKRGPGQVLSAAVYVQCNYTYVVFLYIVCNDNLRSNSKIIVVANRRQQNSNYILLTGYLLGKRIPKKRYWVIGHINGTFGIIWVPFFGVCLLTPTC